MHSKVTLPALQRMKQDGRKIVGVVVYDYQGSEIKRYKLLNCWPKSLEIGSLKAGDTSVLTEKLTVAHEGCEPA